MDVSPPARLVKLQFLDPLGKRPGLSLELYARRGLEASPPVTGTF
jgi:hypothetical protein